MEGPSPPAHPLRSVEAAKTGIRVDIFIGLYSLAVCLKYEVLVGSGILILNPARFTFDFGDSAASGGLLLGA